MERIPVAGPWITDREVAYVTDAVRNAWYERANAYHERFERAFADYVGTRWAVTLPSCTSAIHLALLALGVGPGDEVVVPDLTWIASAAPVSYVGATPVFADVAPDTWCLDPASFERCVTQRTRAVIPVDLYGGMPDMDAIRGIARRSGIVVIEDAAQAIGSEFRGKKAGSLGDVGVFSFHGSKTLTTGEGGMLVTDREDLYRRVQFLSDHGRQPGAKMFWNTEVAYKYKMGNLQAALGLAQLERIGELLQRKRRIFEWYRRELGGIEGLRLNVEPPDVWNTYWMVTVIPDEGFGMEKEGLIEEMRRRGVDGRPVFYPLSSLPAYAHLPFAAGARERNPTSYRLGRLGVNLPSALVLDEGAVLRVCACLREILGC